MPDLITGNEYILRGGRFIRRSINESDLGSQDAILAACSVSAPIMVPRIIPFGQHSISLLVSRTELTMVAQLSHLPFHTHFEASASEPNVLVPVFVPHKGSLLINDPYPIPATMGQMLFVVRYSIAGPQYTLTNCYQFLYRNKELFRLPYPNTYADGRICMGDSFSSGLRALPAAQRESPMACFLHAWSSFHETRMNADLTSDVEIGFYRRSISEDKWLVPTSETIRSFTRSPVSVAFMQGFAL